MTANMGNCGCEKRCMPCAVVGEVSCARSLRVGLVSLVCVVLLGLLPGRAPALTSYQTKALERIEREWRYLRGRCDAAREVLGDIPRLADIATEARKVQERCASGDTQLLAEKRALTRRLAFLSAEVNSLIAPGKQLVATFVEPYQRMGPMMLEHRHGQLQPYVPPPKPAERFSIVALPGEYHAAAVVLTNCTHGALRCKLSVAGLDPREFQLQVRRYLFIEEWYYGPKKRISDPLPLLPKRREAWQITVRPGESIKLYIGMHIGEDVRGSHHAPVRITTHTGESIEMGLSVRVLPARLPATSRFEHLQFMLPGSNFAGKFPDLTAQDLGAHGVTMMEFPFMPKARFSANGELLEADFSMHEAWLQHYGPHVRRMMIFWWSDLAAEDGTEWKVLTPPWCRAFVNLLRAWFKRSAELGYGQERFVLLPCDEAHSRTLADSPDEHVKTVAAAMKAIKRALPELPIIMTLTYYAFPEDVRALLPHMDIAVPHYPMDERLGPAYAPPDYSPRRAYDEEIIPMLKERGTQILSYHVASGISDALLQYNYAYPILAVSVGLNGVSHWAYNDIAGSSWEGQDGGWLDYLFVYDGSEDHFITRRYNRVGERLIPSIRWESLRAGIQTARLLLHLKDASEAGQLPPAVATEVDQILAEARARYGGKTELTHDWVSDVCRRTRLLYARAAVARATSNR